MITEQIKELDAARAKVAELEKLVAAQLNDELASLPAKFGYADMKSFIAALKKAAGGRAPARQRAAGAPKAAPAGGRRKRSLITDETRAEVKRLVEAGKTGAEIAVAVDISIPSVQNIKKALGLVKSGAS